MDNIEAASTSQNDASLAVAGYNNGKISAEEILLLRHLQKAVSETTEENIAFTKEITELLSKLDLEVKMLPNDIKEGLETLSSIVRFEKLSEFDETALRVVRERKIIEEKKRQREQKQMSLMSDKLLRNCMRLRAKLDDLNNAVDSLKHTIDAEEADKNDQECNKKFLSAKLEDYDLTVNSLEKNLNDIEADEIYPEKILSDYGLCLQKRNELADLDETLAQYHDLPPNLLQAKLLVESKRKEYASLQQMM